MKKLILALFSVCLITVLAIWSEAYSNARRKWLGHTADAPPAENRVSPTANPNSTGSIRELAIPELGLGFYYPESWGAIPIVFKDPHNAICAYDVGLQSAIDLCAFSLDQVRACQADGACEGITDVQQWNIDAGELKTLPPGADCSHTSLAGCKVVSLGSDRKALLFYDSRPERKVYVFFKDNYQVRLSMDLYDSYFDTYKDQIPDDGIVPWIEQHRAPAEILTGVAQYDQVANSVHEIFDSPPTPLGGFTGVRRTLADHSNPPRRTDYRLGAS